MVALRPAELTLGERLIENQGVIDALLLEQSRLAAEFARGNEWDLDGFNTPYDWIRFNLKVNGNVASNYLHVGEHAGHLRESADAVYQQDIGYAHLATMAATAHAVKGFDESQLLPIAREHSPGKFFRKCLHYRHSLDAKGYNRDQEELHEQRSLRFNTAQDGCLLISGILDPAGGAAFRSALEPLAKPEGEHDDRTREQRLADAAVDLATAGRPATLQVTATLETLKALPGSAAGEQEFSLPLSSTTVSRVACDCSVTRILLSQESLVMDVGRSKRVIGAAMRKALEIRDRHCQWPGCERSASMCDGHHVVHWAHGGPTDLDNLVLLCRRHHRMVHEAGWQLIKADDGRIITVAPTVRFGLPRGPD
jgi:hypothetical protein